MASTFKTFGNGDIQNTRTLLHESIPVTGSIVSGTYLPAYPVEGNIKNYSHNMFQSVYDYPYLSSSANHLFDISLGYSSQSPVSASANKHNAKKINIYNTFAQQLVGYEATGSSKIIKRFDKDGDETTTTDKINEAYFITFSRLLIKDEIKKGSFKLDLGVSGNFFKPFRKARIRIDDAHAAGTDGNFKINSPAGEYAILKARNLTTNAGGAGGPINHNSGNADKNGVSVGLIYYQAGIVVLTASIFQSIGGSEALLSASVDDGTRGIDLVGSGTAANAGPHMKAHLTGTTISGAADGLRNRIYNMQFNNTTELHSTLYFCRVNNTDFNYSTNPTYVSSSKVVVKENAVDNPVSYVTTIGLYGANNELLAVGKLSEPLKKTPNNEMTLRVRLDY
jgi:hypothetical protein